MMHTFWPGVVVAALALTCVGTAPASAALTIFGTAPRIEAQGPGFSYELGTIFSSSVAGEVIGVRFYMGPNEASNPGGDIVGKLWTGDGTLLASATFANPTEGWNEVDFLSPVLISAGTPYVVSANNNLVNGKNFSANEYPFGYPVASGPLTATAGTYISPAGLFPNNQTSNGASFYGRDVIFEPAQTAAVPEPATLGLWALVSAAVFGSRYRRRPEQPRSALGPRARGGVSISSRPPGANCMHAVMNLGHKVRHSGERRFVATHLRLERLENRLALSGFGPEDGAYFVEPWEGSYADIAVQPGTQALVALGGIAGQTPSTIGLRRYDFDGNVDLSYGTGGVASVGPGGASASALTFQPDGKAAIAGQQQLASGYDVGIGRLTTAGLPDTTFSGDGWATVSTVSGSSSERATGVALQAGGDIIAGGSSSFINSMAASVKPTGALDSGRGGFGQTVRGKPAGYAVSKFGGTAAWFNGIAIQPDDKIVATGMVSMDGLHTRLIVARYTANGALDTAFNKTGYSLLAAPASFDNTQGYAVALQSDGKIVVAGNCLGIDGAADMLVVRYNANGTLDNTFAGVGFLRFDIDGTATVTTELAWSVAIQPDGKIVASGRENLQADTSTKNVLVARFNANGTPDASFGGAGFKLGVPPAGHSFHAEGMTLAGTDIIMAGSDYDSTTGEEHPMLMRLFGANAATTSSSATASTADATDAALLYLLTDPSLTLGKRKG